MKFALKDSMVESASGRTVEGGERSEVTELRNFMPARGGVYRADKWHSPRGSLHHRDLGQRAHPRHP